MRFSHISMTALLLAAATPAFAQDTDPAPEVTITGGAAFVSDYRFRGFSQSNEEFAVQGSIGLEHETGLYVGAWGSSIGFAGGTEIDIFGGYATELTDGIGFDIGLTYYTYPGGTGDTAILEPYVALTGEYGPISSKIGFSYAPVQNSLANESAIYVYGDTSVGIPGTPFSIDGHAGYAKSDSFLGGIDGDVIDLSIGASASYGPLTLGVAYVSTDLPSGPTKEALGADGAVVFSVSASF